MTEEYVQQVKTYMNETIPYLYKRGTITKTQLGLLIKTGEAQLWPGNLKYRVLVSGSRYWGESYRDFIRKSLLWLPPWSVLAHGACRGVDVMAAESVPEGVGTVPYPAPWDTWKEIGLSSRNAAGPYRNRQMYDDFLPHLVMAFHGGLVATGGTKNMADYARERGCEVWWVTPTGRIVLP